MMNYLVNMNRHLRITLLLSGFFLSFLLFFITANGWFILPMFIFLGILIASNIQYDKRFLMNMGKSLENTLAKNDIKVDDSYLSDDYLSGIAINESDCKLFILTRRNLIDDFRIKKIKFNDIVECAIKEDGNTVTTSSKGSVIGGAIVGGVIAGGIGSVIGGLSGDKTSNENILKATLTIVVDDLMNPVYDIHFLNSNIYVAKNSDTYQQVYTNMNKWYRRLNVILNRNKLNSKLV
jgi:hypothetical protein